VLCVVNFNSGIQKKAYAPLKKTISRQLLVPKPMLEFPKVFGSSPTRVPKKFKGAEEERKGEKQRKFFMRYFLYCILY